MRRRLHLVVLPAAAFFGVLPLLLHGCSCGHDFSFHLISWLDAARQFSGGNLQPHWAYSPAFGAGEPRFVFYPPLSWTIGALLTLLLSHLPHVSPDRAFAFVPILYTWIALCAAGLSMHVLLRRYASPGVALLAATLYLGNPYTLFTAYERTAFAELLAAAWIPLLLLAILPHLAPQTHSAAQTEPSPISIPLLALAVALLWLTNAPAAVMGCYTVALIAVLHLSGTYRLHHNIRSLLRPAAHFIAGTTLGLALAAFYIVPAASERRWVQIVMATIPSLRIADNTPFHHTGDPAHDAVLRTVGITAILLFSVTAFALARTWTRSSAPAESHLLRLLGILTVTIAVLLTPIALPFWRYAPELAFLQFPWRLVAILAAVMAVAVALALRSVPHQMPAAIAISLAVAAALSFGAYTSFAQSCDPTDTPQAQLTLFQSAAGTDPTDEYTPVTADNDSLHPGNPPFALISPVLGSTTVTPGPPTSQAPQHLDLDLSAPEQLVLNLRSYPAWLVTRNGLPVTELLERDDGLIAFTLPAGHSHIEVTYRTTPDRRIGNAISAVALCVFVPLSWTSLRRRRRSWPDRRPKR